MQDFSNKKILLGISGGVAAYKSAYLVRELTSLGADVRVVMTQSAQQFISPLLMQALSTHEVRTELFDSQAERAMGHIELARWADYFVIAPATANCIAQMAQGLAADLLTTLYLVAEIPVFICPAMNHSMYEHPATQANIKLVQERGVFIVGPDRGAQACGEYGLGRVSEPAHIITALRLYETRNLLAGKQVLITAGPTREAIDPVRYVSNFSSGKMGYALAEAAAMAGAKVTLIAGPTALHASASIKVVKVDSAQEMHHAVLKYLQQDCIYIGAAAVADYTVDEPAIEKMKKHQQETLELKLVKTTDIVSAVVASKKAAFVVGFAAETKDLIQYATEKMRKKQLDMIIANQVGKGQGFENDSNQVSILTKNKQIDLPLTHKTRLAGQIIAILAANLHN